MQKYSTLYSCRKSRFRSGTTVCSVITQPSGFYISKWALGEKTCRDRNAEAFLRTEQLQITFEDIRHVSSLSSDLFVRPLFYHNSGINKETNRLS